MRLIAAHVLAALVASLKTALPARFTGKVVLTLNFHEGACGRAVVGVEEGVTL